MANINRSWKPELTELEQQLVQGDQNDQSYAAQVAGQAEVNAKAHANQGDTATLNAAKSDATSKANAAKAHADQGDTATLNAAKTDASGKANTAETNAKNYADTKKTEAINAAAIDATNKANAAENNAKGYADNIGTHKINYVGGYSDGSKLVQDYATDKGYGIHIGRIGSSNNSGYPASYGAVATFVSNSDYGFDLVYNRLGEHYLYYRPYTGGAWGSFEVVYTSKSLTLSEYKAVGAIGTYAFLRPDTAQTDEFGNTTYNNLSAGQTISGSNLNYVGTSNVGTSEGGSPSGTWRCMGDSTADKATLFLRIA